MEPHIHPFEVKSKKDQTAYGFLNTSPEFELKRFMSLNPSCEKIYNINFSFRDEPRSPIHRPSFIMLEWYRTQHFYTQIITDTKNLINFSIKKLQEKSYTINKSIIDSEWIDKSVQQLFIEELNIDILEYLETDKLRTLIENNFKNVPLPNCELSWDDLFFLLFLNEIEPKLTKYPKLILKEYPHHLSALSTINTDDSRVCDRFELYLNGVEIANCYNELTNFQEQSTRFKMQAEQKTSLYNYELPWPDEFLKALETGLPNSCGIALGVERLLAILINDQSVFYT